MLPLRVNCNNVTDLHEVGAAHDVVSVVLEGQLARLAHGLESSKVDHTVNFVLQGQKNIARTCPKGVAFLQLPCS